MYQAWGGGGGGGINVMQKRGMGVTCVSSCGT